MHTLSVRDTRTVVRDSDPFRRRLTAFERHHGVKVARPARTSSRQAAIRASLAGC